jgi:two-component system, response regulator YesN
MKGDSMAWKILIADDEPMIREGLREAVLMALPGAVIAAEAEDGEEALALARSERPDILLVDIRMPFLSGLQLVERLAGLELDCKVIVVSGHDEFEYARQALTLGVFDYLLKPVEQEALAGALGRATAALLARRERLESMRRSRAELERNKPLLRQLLLREIAEGRADAAEAEDRLELLGVAVPNPACVTLVVPGISSPAGGARERMEASISLAALVDEVLGPYGPAASFGDGSDGVIAICRPGAGPEWADVPAEIAARAERRLGVPVSVAQRIVPGGAGRLASALPDLLEELREESGGRSDALALRARSWIERSYMRPELTLEEAAAEVGASPSHLSRVMKRETGKSFVEYLAAYRVARAMAMMADPGMKMLEVAESSGFASQHYFSRVFKRVAGISPSEYRAEAAR